MERGEVREANDGRDCDGECEDYREDGHAFQFEFLVGAGCEVASQGLAGWTLLFEGAATEGGDEGDGEANADDGEWDDDVHGGHVLAHCLGVALRVGLFEGGLVLG